MDLSTIALQGLQQADAGLQSAEIKIASFAASSTGGANQDTVDLSAAVVALLSAKNLYSAQQRENGGRNTEDLNRYDRLNHFH